MPVGLYPLFLSLGLFSWALGALLPLPTAPRVGLVVAVVCFLLAAILAVVDVHSVTAALGAYV